MPDSDVTLEDITLEYELWLDELLLDGAPPNSPEFLKNDLLVALDWLGVKAVSEVGARERRQWVRGFKQFDVKRLDWLYGPGKSGVPDILEPSLTDEIRAVFDRLKEIDFHRMFLPDEERIRGRIKLSDPRVAPVSLLSPTNERRDDSSHSTMPDSVSMKLVAKGVVGFASGFMLVFGLEVLLFSGMDLLSGHWLRPAGAGWILMPIAAGCGGWALFREIDFSKLIGADRTVAELRKWPREHQIAFAVAAAIGWIAGVLIGYVASIASGADYYPRTLETWLFGRWDWSSYGGLTVRYFPWASLGWGFVGGALGAAIVYTKQLLRF